VERNEGSEEGYGPHFQGFVGEDTERKKERHEEQYRWAYGELL